MESFHAFWVLIWIFEVENAFKNEKFNIKLKI